MLWTEDGSRNLGRGWAVADRHVRRAERSAEVDLEQMLVNRCAPARGACSLAKTETRPVEATLA